MHTSIQALHTTKPQSIPHGVLSARMVFTPKFGFNETGLKIRHELSWIFKLHSLAPLAINQRVRYGYILIAYALKAISLFYLQSSNTFQGYEMKSRMNEWHCSFFSVTNQGRRSLFGGIRKRLSSGKQIRTDTIVWKGITYTSAELPQ